MYTFQLVHNFSLYQLHSCTISIFNSLSWGTHVAQLHNVTNQFNLNGKLKLLNYL